MLGLSLTYENQKSLLVKTSGWRDQIPDLANPIWVLEGMNALGKDVPTNPAMM